MEFSWKQFGNSAMGEHFNLKADPQMKKELILINETIKFDNTMKLKGSCIHFCSFLSKQQLSTKSQTFKHLKKDTFYLVFADQKHTSVTSRAGLISTSSALPGYINMIQNTYIAVHRVEQQKTVYIKKAWETDKMVFNSNQKVF